MGSEKLVMDLDACKSLREMVFETIRNAIVMGKLKPGERLMEVQLAEQLGVSRTPVRESIRKLELEGLVKMEPRRGAYVTPLRVKDFKEMMEIRRALEGLSAELAAVHATDEEIEKLRETNQLFKESALANDEKGIMSHDIEFHDTLYQSSQNEKLSTMINSLREQLQRIRMEYVQNIEDKIPLIGQHEVIIDCIEKKDALGACAAAASHIARTEEDMLKVIAENSEEVRL